MTDGDVQTLYPTCNVYSTLPTEFWIISDEIEQGRMGQKNSHHLKKKRKQAIMLKWNYTDVALCQIIGEIDFSKNVAKCVSNLSKIIFFCMIRLDCNSIFGESKHNWWVVYLY